MNEGPRARSGGPALGMLIALLVTAGLLRVGFAAHKGLVLDEFHSYFHATRAGIAAILASARLDNHPPLSFLLIAASRELFGESELALRAPAIACSLVELACVAALARSLGAPPLVAAGLLAVSSLALDYATQARMYALLSLSVTALTLSVARALDGRGKGAVGVALSTFAGLHAHYYFLEYFGLLALGLAVLAACDRNARARLRILLLPCGIALACALPWYLWGFRAQLAQSLAPGRSELGLAALGEAYVHLFFLNVRLGGPLLRPAFIVAGLVVLLAACVGLASALRARRRLGLVLGLVGLCLPAVAQGLVQVAPRAGFHWPYVLPSAAPLACLAALAWDRGRAARAALGTAGAAALVLCGLHLASRGTEDYEGAVARVAALHRRGDAIVAVAWQPPFFAQHLAFDYYAPRVARGLEALEMRSFDLARPSELAGARRVLLLRKSLPEDQALMRRLHADFVRVASERFGWDLSVETFEGRR